MNNLTHRRIIIMLGMAGLYVGVYGAARLLTVLVSLLRGDFNPF